MLERQRQKNVQGGRPRKREVKLSEDDDQILTAAAAAERITVPAFLVQAGLNAAGAMGEPQRRAAAFDLLRVEHQLSRIGNNLNQIARQLNAGGGVHSDVVRTLAEVRAELRHVGGAADAFVDEARR